MIKDLKVNLNKIKGKLVLVTAGIGAGVLVMSGCSKENVISTEKPSDVIVSEVPSEVVSEEVSEEVVEENPYQHIPEDLLDENGIYHPEEVTADMLRDRFADVDEYIESHGFAEIGKNNIKASIMRANYSFMSDETFTEIINEYGIDITEMGNYNYYDEDDYPVEKMTFDPYLQYEAKVFYDVHYRISEAQKNNDTTAFYDAKRELNNLMKNGDNLPIVPPYGDKTNLYDKTDFFCPVAVFELTYGINKDNYLNYMSEDTPKEILDYNSLFGGIKSNVDAKTLVK